MSNNKFQEYTYDYLMQLALSFVKDDKDKRQGSVVYDCLGPFCQLLAAGAMELRNFYLETYALTATGENLDNRVKEHNITRYPATYAVKRIDLEDRDNKPVVVPLGIRFSTVSDTNPINYVITDYYKENGEPVPGSYEATCEQEGTVGNEYSGNVINISFVQGLAQATMTTLLTPARDVEDDEKLRERYFEALNENPFGGNIADYKVKVKAIPGVGAVQIYPVWNGGGTVKVCIVDTQYNPCSDDFMKQVQDELDPENSRGERALGLGAAPIGHKVTVTTPEIKEVTVKAKIVLMTNFTLESVQSSIKSAVEDYINKVRYSWADTYNANDYMSIISRAKIVAAILEIPGVANVDLNEVELNDHKADITLEQSNFKQEIPECAEVILSV